MELENADFSDTALHEAVRYGDVHGVKKALKDGLDPNQIGLYQWSPLHEAASLGDVEVLKLLLKFKGDPNTADCLHGCTTLHYAAKEDHPDCLKALLTAGGQTDLKNHHGETCVDVAEGECRKMLEEHKDKLRVKDLLAMSASQARQLVIKQQEEELANSRNRGGDSSNGGDGRTGGSGNHSDDRTDASEAAETAWGDRQDKPVSLEEEAVGGSLLLSFEYNSRKAVLKVRVWELQDLLLPPADTSMIASLHVKSLLLPDKKGQTKRKTEDVKVDLEEQQPKVKYEIKGKGEGTKVTFVPTKFSFKKGLEYEDVGKDMVEMRTVRLEVCIKQRFTGKSFMVASLELPLKVAVKKLLKEKFPLRVHINPSMPHSLQAYTLQDLVVSNSSVVTVSNPDLRSASLTRLRANDPAPRAHSDGDLKQVSSQRSGNVPSIVINIPQEDSDTSDTLRQIRVMEHKDRVSHISRSESDLQFTANIPTDQDMLRQVLIGRTAMAKSSPNISLNMDEPEEGPDRIDVQMPGTVPESKVDIPKSRSKGTDMRTKDRRQEKKKLSKRRSEEASVICMEPVSSTIVEVEEIPEEKDSPRHRSRPMSPRQKEGKEETGNRRRHREEKRSSPLPDITDKGFDSEIDKRVSKTREGTKEDSGVDRKSKKKVPFLKKKAREKRLEGMVLENKQTDYQGTGESGMQETSFVSQRDKSPRPGHAIRQDDRENKRTTKMDERRRREQLERVRPKSPFEKAGELLPTINTKSRRNRREAERYIMSDEEDDLSPPEPSAVPVKGWMGAEIKTAEPKVKTGHRSRSKSKERVLAEHGKDAGQETPKGVLRQNLVDQYRLQMKHLATPEYRLQLFQRTGNQPHPATPGVLHLQETDLSTSAIEQMDPFFVPESPTQSPLALQTSHRVDQSGALLHSKRGRDQSPAKLRSSSKPDKSGTEMKYFPGRQQKKKELKDFDLETSEV
ncbi:ankyrin repeat domain-containing protein 12-like [Branchiostoma lanceolatum]|uniref:ankyrin repeat domain-containing protein 12-like n=1 Tax=Branchiostoma lanceolatum TaxID=7740 RepID=UPI0034550DCF